MAITINSFYRLYDYPDAVIRVGSTIRETVLQRTVQNHNNAWAKLNRRALLHYAPVSPVELTGSFVTILDVGVYLSSGRGEMSLEIDVYGTDFQVQVELFNLSAASLGSASATQVGAGHVALTLTPSSAATTGYLQVRARYDSSGPGEIARVRVLEGAIASASDFAAPWKPIDSDAVGENEYLHAAVGRRCVENLVTLGTYRQRRPCANWRADDPPKLHGMTTELAQFAELGGDVRTVIPFLVPRPRFGTTINVRVRGRAIGQNVTVGAVQLPLRPGQPLGTDEDTATFTPSGSLSTLSSIQIDTTSWRNEVHLVLLTITSAFDATGEELEKVGVTPDLEVEPPFVIAEDGSEWSTAGAVVDEIGAYWIEFVQGVQSSTTPSNPNPGKRLMLRVVEDADGSGDGSRLYLYPPIPPGQAVLALSESGKSSSGVWVRRHAIGTLALASVEWDVDTSTIDLDGSWADAMEPGARTLALVARRLQTLGDTIWGRCTRVHHCGPAADPGTVDPDASLTGAADKLTSAIDYSTSWETLADCVVGDEDPFEVFTGDDFERSVYVVDALVAVVVENELDVRGAAVERERLFDYNFRLQLGTIAGASFADGVVADGGRVDDVPISAHVHTFYGFDDPLGYWMGFWPGGYRFPGAPTSYPPDSNFSAQPELAAHSGRGVIPAGLWPALKFQYVRLTLKDTAGATNPRLLRLQAQAQGPHGGGDIGLLAPRLHLLTWTVRTLEGTDADSITPT